MATHGAFGGAHPCRKYHESLLMCMASTPSPTMCALDREDYMECVHGNKKRIRMLQLYENRAAQVQAAKAQAADQAKSK